MHDQSGRLVERMTVAVLIQDRSGSGSACGTGSTGSGTSMLMPCPVFTGWLALASRPPTRTWPSLISR